MAKPSKLDEGPGPLQIESIYVFGNCAMYLGEQIEEEIRSRNIKVYIMVTFPSGWVAL